MSYKFNPFTGNLDYYKDGSDNFNIVKKICAVPISALQMVQSTSVTEIIQGDSALDYINSKVLGIALQSGNIGSEIEVLTRGELTDPFFNFIIGPLFLRTNGLISDVPPTIPSEVYLTNVGYAITNDSIYIDIQEPVQL